SHDLVLQVEVELLDVRPIQLRRVGRDARGAGETSAADVRVSDDVVLRGRQDSWRLTLESGDSFVAVQVLPEDAVAAPDGPLTIAEQVVGEPEPRRPIQVSAVIAAPRRPVGSARDLAVIRVADAGNQVALYSGDVAGNIDLRSLCGIVARWVEIVELVVFLPITAEAAETQSNV